MSWQIVKDIGYNDNIYILYGAYIVHYPMSFTIWYNVFYDLCIGFREVCLLYVCLYVYVCLSDIHKCVQHYHTIYIVWLYNISYKMCTALSLITPPPHTHTHTHTYTYKHIYTLTNTYAHTHAHTCPYMAEGAGVGRGGGRLMAQTHTCTRTHSLWYGLALVSRIDKIISLFCKRAL